MTSERFAKTVPSQNLGLDARQAPESDANDKFKGAEPPSNRQEPHNLRSVPECRNDFGQNRPLKSGPFYLSLSHIKL